VFAKNEFGHSPVMEKSKVDQSYVLFSPLAMGQFLTHPGRVYLTDLYGKPVHVWETKYQTMFSTLRKNGNLVVELIKPADLIGNPGGGGTGIIQELDWNGNVLWEYENSMLHHDFEALPGGGVAVLVWEKISADKAQMIKGGKEDLKEEDYWGDAILEIDRNSKEIWRWSAAQNLDPRKYVLGPLTPKNEWTHGNSIRYYETNPFSSKPIYLLSFRHLNRVFMIERETGKIVWESREKMLSYQHDATLLDNGNILVFDNGLFRDQDRPLLWSRVVEIDPRTDTIVWEFNGGKTGPEKAKFSPSIMSGAQRLGNGNTFIIDAVRGHFFEADMNGHIVWDFINPFLSTKSGPFDNNTVFKARRYSPQEIDWPEEMAPPLPRAYLCARLDGIG
jgi:hypothetical protein